MAQAFEFYDPRIGREGQTGGDLLLVVNNFREQDLGSGSQTATGHLLRVAHQLIEVNLGGCDEGADASTTFHDPFTFQRGQGVAGGHQADLMNFGEISFRRNRVPGAQLAGFNALANHALNALRIRHAVSTLLTDSLPDSIVDSTTPRFDEPLQLQQKKQWRPRSNRLQCTAAKQLKTTHPDRLALACHVL